MELIKLSPRQFDRFSDFIYAQSGIRIEASKITLASNRIRRRLKACECSDFDAYYRLLTSPAGKGELALFLDAITTNETQFFRTPAHFDWFQETFLPECLAAERRGERQRTLRLWSAACSTGEEAYSLAICVAEQIGRLRGWRTTILGTDISEAALGAAREASYDERSLELVGAARTKRHFDRLPLGERQVERWRLRPAARDLVEFRRHNLMRPLRAAPFDCIFVRNVLIYFDRASKEAVIEHLQSALARGGYLVVGPSEGIYDMLAPLVKRATHLYQKV